MSQSEGITVRACGKLHTGQCLYVHFVYLIARDPTKFGKELIHLGLVQIRVWSYRSQVQHALQAFNKTRMQRNICQIST